MNETRTYTTGEVASFFGVSDDAVRKWCNDGYLGTYVTTPGGHRRIIERDLRRFVYRYAKDTDLIQHIEPWLESHGREVWVGDDQ